MSNKDWLVLSIVTFLTVAGWTVYDIYHAAVSSTITPVQEQLVRQLEPKFDIDTLQKIQDRSE